MSALAWRIWDRVDGWPDLARFGVGFALGLPLVAAGHVLARLVA